MIPIHYPDLLNTLIYSCSYDCFGLTNSSEELKIAVYCGREKEKKRWKDDRGILITECLRRR